MTNDVSHLKLYEYVMANVDQIAINKKKTEDDHRMKQISFGAFEALSNYFKSNNNSVMADNMTRLAQRLRDLDQEPPQQQEDMRILGQFVKYKIMEEYDDPEVNTKDLACEIFTKHMNMLEETLDAVTDDMVQDIEEANVSGEVSDEMKQRIQDYIDKAQEAQKQQS